MSATCVSRAEFSQFLAQAIRAPPCPALAGCIAGTEVCLSRTLFHAMKTANGRVWGCRNGQPLVGDAVSRSMSGVTDRDDKVLCPRSGRLYVLVWLDWGTVRYVRFTLTSSSERCTDGTIGNSFSPSAYQVHLSRRQKRIAVVQTPLVYHKSTATSHTKLLCPLFNAAVNA